MLQDGEGGVNTNLYNDRKSSYRLSKAISMLIRGPSCFDFNFYRSKSADLAVLTDEDKLWQHFVRNGQFEGRVFRCILIEKPTSAPHGVVLLCLPSLSACIPGIASLQLLDST